MAQRAASTHRSYIQCAQALRPSGPWRSWGSVVGMQSYCGPYNMDALIAEIYLSMIKTFCCSIARALHAEIGQQVVAGHRTVRQFDS